MSDEIYQISKGLGESASKPLCKLIGAVQSAVGMVYEPTHIRRIAKAESDKLLIMEETQIALSELRERAVARISNTEIRRQENIESIVHNASNNLPEECSEDLVDQDWMADFFDCCKDVGNEQVQSLWGKLLAGEVTEPGTYSRRALNTLKLMSSSEASLFMLISFRIWHLDGWPILLIPSDMSGKWSDSCPFNWSHISTLTDAGLLESDLKNEIHYLDSRKEDYVFDYFGQRFIGRTNPIRNSILSWINFSAIGVELLSLVEKEGGVRDDYYDDCAQYLSVPKWISDDSDACILEIPDEELLQSLNLNRP